jgi:hypothetical protein
MAARAERERRQQQQALLREQVLPTRINSVPTPCPRSDRWLLHPFLITLARFWSLPSFLRPTDIVSTAVTNAVVRACACVRGHAAEGASSVGHGAHRADGHARAGGAGAGAAAAAGGGAGEHPAPARCLSLATHPAPARTQGVFVSWAGFCQLGGAWSVSGLGVSQLPKAEGARPGRAYVTGRQAGCCPGG